MERIPVIDAHVHFWTPGELHYPWLEALPALHRPFLPPGYAAATAEGAVPVERLVFIEANCLPDESLREVAFAARLADEEPRLAAIVAYVDLTDVAGRGPALDAVSRSPLVKGIRQNVQGQPAGFCRTPAFVEGVREVGRRGLTFDLGATHDQLDEVAELVDRCPGTRFVLDHCGKPAIRERRLEPWRTTLARLAERENLVACKLSGLLTEANVAAWRADDLLPYASHVVDCFGPARLLYGSDWPVLTLAGHYADWYRFTRCLAAAWSEDERRAFYAGNAARVYDL